MNTLIICTAIYLTAALSSSVVVAYTTVPKSSTKQSKQTFANRRAFLSTTIASIAAISTSNPNRVLAANDDQDEVYFGAGCFWHVQHEFIAAERTLLNRKDNELTSLTGYAGGLGGSDKEGRVCYHNFQSVADYGKLGHGEVVGMKIPQSSISDFAVEYFKLFGDKGERADPMDKGGEYRSLLGLPGGRNHPMFDTVEAAASAQGMKLVDGKGSDPDTLGKRQVFVYDTKKFPFYQGEFYHQYHNDFLTPAYGKAYNDLAETALDDGRIKITGCPDRVHKMKTMMKQNEPIILGSIGIVTVCLLLGGMYLVWTRPRFLYMPIMESYEKDSDIGTEDIETELT